MLDAIGSVFPISVAVALSSVPIMATILILLSPNRNRSALPFLIGWVLGLAIVVTIFMGFAQLLPGPAPKHPQVALGITMIVLGLALMAFAIIQWRRAVVAPENELPRWLRAVGALGPWSSFGLAMLLNIRAKALFLAAAAALAVRGDSLTIGDDAVVIIVYTVISACTVGVPIVATLVAPNKMESRLIVTRSWIARNNRIVTIMIMLLIGVFVVSSGLTRL